MFDNNRIYTCKNHLISLRDSFLSKKIDFSEEKNYFLMREAFERCITALERDEDLLDSERDLKQPVSVLIDEYLEPSLKEILVRMVLNLLFKE